MRPIIYIASPLSGDIERNLEFARKACSYAISKGVNPFCPHLFYTQMLNDNIQEERKIGMALGIEMLAKCNGLWLCGDRISAGMESERKEAERIGIPITQIPAGEILEMYSSKE